MKFQVFLFCTLTFSAECAWGELWTIFSWKDYENSSESWI